MILNFKWTGNESSDSYSGWELTPSSVQLRQTLCADLGLLTQLSRNHMVTRKQTENCDPHDKDFRICLKSRPTWTSSPWLSPLSVSSGEFERGMSVNLPRLVKNNWMSPVYGWKSRMSMPWQVILSGFTIRYLSGWDTVTVGKINLNLNHCQPLPWNFMKVSAKNVMKQKSFHKGLSNCVKVLFSL